jgi:hypothetical protein
VRQPRQKQLQSKQPHDRPRRQKRKQLNNAHWQKSVPKPTGVRQRKPVRQPRQKQLQSEQPHNRPRRQKRKQLNNAH